MASIASAAIVSGELILGLDDGSIIRAGYVQGPQGLQGERGPQGSTGRPGRDGNGLLHGAGIPTFDDGQDGDFYIDIKEWKAYGPKIGGKWGSGVALLPKDRGGMLPTGMRTQGGGASGARAFAGGISGPSSGGIPGPPSTAGLDLIAGHNQPFPALTTTSIASDPKGDAMHVLVKADSATGSWYGEIIATHFNTNPAHSIAWEVHVDAFPNLTFDAIWNVDHLELQMTSDVPLVNVRGRIIYV